MTTRQRAPARSTATPMPGGVVRRACECGQHSAAGAECGACKQKREGMWQPAALDPSPALEVPPIVHEVLASPGQPLDAATRAFMGPRFEHDFSRVPVHASGSVPARLSLGTLHDVAEQEAAMVAQRVMGRSPASTSTGYDFSEIRIHTDARAAESARALHALAYTVGRDIVFGHGQYAPQTRAGATLLAHELTHVIQQRGGREPGAGQRPDRGHPAPRRSGMDGVIARQPAPTPPAAPGWSDAPAKSPNVAETTVDEKGNILTDKTVKGVRRIPLEGLRHGHKGKDKGPAHESPEGRAVVLIPNTVNPAASAKGENVRVDVLLHFHGFGIGYRQLKPRKQDFGQTLQADQVRDVELYQMEQQLLSHVASSKQLIIAVLPQGSETSKFGDLGASSEAYLQEVFGKLIPAYLPEHAVPGRVIVSGHSGGGVPAMAVANQRAKAGKRTDVLLFDAINFDKKTCTSNEVTTVKEWISRRIADDVKSVDGIAEEQQAATLQTDGTRFRGVTSNTLTTTDKCSYGFHYNEVKKHIETTISKLKVSDTVRAQLRHNYQVLEAQRLGDLKGMERHERMLGAQNLENALTD